MVSGKEGMSSACSEFTLRSCLHMALTVEKDIKAKSINQPIILSVFRLPHRWLAVKRECLAPVLSLSRMLGEKSCARTVNTPGLNIVEVTIIND